MGKAKMEKEKKKPLVAVEAPKDRVKKKNKVKKAKIADKPVMKEVSGSDDEAPEAIPIKHEQEIPVVSKNKKKKDKKPKSEAVLKIKKQSMKERKHLEKMGKVTAKVKRATKSLTVEEPVVEDPADPPEILASTDAIRTAVIALRKATEEEAKDKKKLFDKDFKYCLQICATKVPKVPSRMVRLNLPHSLYDDTDDICLIVRDEVRGSQHDPELTVLKYEQLFREQKIDFIKKVLPLREMKQNYGSYELKRKLANTYDLFLCDRIVSGMAFSFTGKYFVEKRKCPVPVKIKFAEASDLKDELKKGIHKTTYKQRSHSFTFAIEVATHKHTVEQFVDNIESLFEQLKKEFPGGWVNIKNIYLKPMMHSIVSLPLYITEIDPNRVPVPVEVGPKFRHLMKVAKKLENESKKFKLEEGFKLNKKRGENKRKAVEVKSEEDGEKKIKVETEEIENEENDDSGVQSDHEEEEEEQVKEEKSDEPKLEVKKQKKNKKNQKKEKKVQPQPVSGEKKGKKAKKASSTDSVEKPNKKAKMLEKKQANKNASPKKAFKKQGKKKVKA